MISYLGSLVQLSPAAGRAGRCRQMSLCVGSTRCVPARQPVLEASLRVWCTFSLSGERLRQPEVWSPLHGRAAPFPSAAPARPGRVSGSLQTGPGACLPGGRGWLLWSFSVPLFCEPPAVCSGQSIFLLLSHSLKKSPSDCSRGLLAGPHPKQCRRLLSVPPPLAGGGCGRLGYFSAGSCF